METIAFTLGPLGRVALGLAAATLSLWSSAAPLLRCQVTYAGTTHTVEARPVADPYPVPSVDIGGRFRFKAVMVGSAQRVDYIKLYAYVETRRQPVLVQEAKYLPPYPPAVPPATAVLLTGEQYLYAGAVERELIYRCTLEGLS
jgi:hypothetical protein